MADILQVKAIKAKKMNVDAFRRVIERALISEGKETEKALAPTVSSWTSDKPRFDSIIDTTGGDASVLTGPVGSEMAVKKFRWLDEGTSIRWALMSRDWRSKTRVGVLKSGRGRGKVVIAGRRAMTARNIGPRPGIEGRGWTELVRKRRKPKFTRAMVAAMQEGARKLY